MFKRIKQFFEDVWDTFQDWRSMDYITDIRHPPVWYTHTYAIETLSPVTLPCGQEPPVHLVTSVRTKRAPQSVTDMWWNEGPVAVDGLVIDVAPTNKPNHAHAIRIYERYLRDKAKRPTVYHK